jgi:hypothetical protein
MQAVLTRIHLFVRISDYSQSAARQWIEQSSIEVRRGDFGVGKKLMPAAIAPQGLQAHQGFVSGGGPELASAFEAAFVLAAGGFDGARTQGFIAFEDLGWSGCAFLHGFSIRAFPHRII